MSQVAALREQSREFREKADQETTPRLKQLLASHAQALTQLAEKIERESAT